MVKSLHSALKQKKTIEHFIEEAWQLAKVKLYKNEKKASINGLNGSLMFKIVGKMRLHRTIFNLIISLAVKALILKTDEKPSAPGIVSFTLYCFMGLSLRLCLQH